MRLTLLATRWLGIAVALFGLSACQRSFEPQAATDDILKRLELPSSDAVAECATLNRDLQTLKNQICVAHGQSASTVLELVTKRLEKTDAQPERAWLESQFGYVRTWSYEGDLGIYSVTVTDNVIRMAWF